MELILTEWLGIGESVKLFDFSNSNNNKLHLVNYEDELRQINDAISKEKKEEKILSKIKSKTLKKNIDVNISNWQEILLNIYKLNLQLIFKEHKEAIFAELNRINSLHKSKFNRPSEVNPICEFIEINGEICVNTYQYAAEFEIKLGDKNKETLKIKIEPRNLINEENFKKMLETIFNFHRLENISGTNSSSLLILYFLAFIGRLTEVLKQGVYREYVELEENLSFLKEKLIISEHLRLNHYNKHKVYCEFSELTPDNIINQTIKTTLNFIQKRFYNYDDLQHKVRKLRSGFFNEDISDNPDCLKSIRNIRYNRQNKRYEEIMTYCDYILQNIGGSFSSQNKMNYSAFYLDMNDLFEKYVQNKLNLLRTTNNNANEGFDKIKTILEEINGQNDDYWYIDYQKPEYLDEDNIFKIIPDFIIKNSAGKVLAVADAKYKRLNDKKYEHYGIANNDIYQLLTYSIKLETNTIFLIYPKPEKNFEEIKEFNIQHKNQEIINIHICLINLLD